MCKPAKVTQRAARKAAAACLARQRHKSFVNSLQDQAAALQARVSVLKQRRHDMFGACAAFMLDRMDDRLSVPRMVQLRRWLVRSPKLAASMRSVTASSSRCASPVPTPPKLPELTSNADAKSNELTYSCTPASETPKVGAKDTMALDEELSKQVLMAEAMATMQPLASDDADQDEDDELVDEWIEPVLHSFELQEAYGDGLMLLLQHLATARQPSVQAWLQLKLEAERASDAAASEWTNLSDLEEDFVLINHEHLRGSGESGFSAPIVPNAVY